MSGITLDAYVEGQPREIYIYYKLLDEQLKDKTSLFLRRIYVIYQPYESVLLFGKRTTMNVYTDATSDFKKKEFQTLEKLLKGGSAE